MTLHTQSADYGALLRARFMIYYAAYALLCAALAPLRYAIILRFYC